MCLSAQGQGSMPLSEHAAFSVPVAYKRHERDLRRSDDFFAGLKERTGLVAGDRRSGELWKSRTPATAESIRQ
ncbi:hypothetical protein MTO96_051036 [Rhipicephalus appendiculatus]